MPIHQTTAIGQLRTGSGYHVANVYEYVSNDRELFSHSAEWVHSEVAVIAPNLDDLIRVASRVAQTQLAFVALQGPPDW
jgi:hypothetical protein